MFWECLKGHKNSEQISNEQTRRKPIPAHFPRRVTASADKRSWIGLWCCMGTFRFYLRWPESYVRYHNARYCEVSPTISWDARLGDLVNLVKRLYNKLGLPSDMDNSSYLPEGPSYLPHSALRTPVWVHRGNNRSDMDNTHAFHHWAADVNDNRKVWSGDLENTNQTVMLLDLLNDLDDCRNEAQSACYATAHNRYLIVPSTTWQYVIKMKPKAPATNVGFAKFKSTR